VQWKYSPVPQDENGQIQHKSHQHDEDLILKKRLPFCIGICVLLSILYVLSRTGASITTCDTLPLAIDDSTIGQYRAAKLASTPPHIIECSEAKEGGSQEACHLPKQRRYQALNQKGATLWMTGLSGSGKSTIATALEEELVLKYGKHVRLLDGDNVRTGLNRDLGFSKEDRAESVRRVGEMACLFSDAGVITIVSLVSPYRADRDAVRQRHEEQGIKFFEVFMDVPLNIVAERDPKGLYEKVFRGEITGFTGVDDPYEAPEKAEIVLPNYEMTVEECVFELLKMLEKHGILVGGKYDESGLLIPDGDENIDLLVPSSLVISKKTEALTLPRALLTDIDLNWLQVIAEGWAAPLKGFMREGTLLQTLHFNSILYDPYNLTGNGAINEKQTNWNEFSRQPPLRVSQSVPIVLPITGFTKKQIELSGKKAVTLTTKDGKDIAILRNPEIYENRKEEIVTRMFGVIDPGHPYIRHIYSGGDWLLGGEIELLERITYNDGLDRYRLTATELREEFKRKGGDVVFAFQTRNPTHAGHAYLMKSARETLLKKGYKNPILWLSPLGGWTKEDDVPLDVRVLQHEAVLREGMLDSETTVLAIWPAPMVYAGPTEVQFHAKSRRVGGAKYFVAGRDPAGMKGSELAVSHPDDDLYKGEHGRYVLQMSPGLGEMEIVSFDKVYYDVKDHTMKVEDPSRPDDFISISGSKMRALARAGATPCPSTLPPDIVEANCVPPGFMVESGWKIVCDYYQNVESPKWIPWSRPVINPKIGQYLSSYGSYGKKDYALYFIDANNQKISPWHDISLLSHSDSLYNFIVEIPMYTTAKMEVTKDVKYNPIMQDVSHGQPRYYTYGVPFFNYGLFPQTFEDPTYKKYGYYGDNDPLDVIEVGSEPIPMGSVVAVKVLGAFILIDEGELDYKIIAIRDDDPIAYKVHDVLSLEKVKPGIIANLIDWLKNYKTSDGKPQNQLYQETPFSPKEAVQIISECNHHWSKLTNGTHSNPDGFSLPIVLQ